MDETSLQNSLADLSLGQIRFFQQTGSTNDVALTWAGAGAPDLSIVCAEEQTAGRGRGRRSWFTPPGTALAFSIINRPSPAEQASILFFCALGALAVSQVIEAYGLTAQIKWPNDVLIAGRKVCGVLPESLWMGDKVDAVVVGLGINIAPAAVPPAGQLNFPATSLLTELLNRKQNDPVQAVDRQIFLKQILQSFLAWRRQLGSGFFMSSWESRLAFRGAPVEIWSETESLKTGILEGLGPDGSLWLRTDAGAVEAVQFGEVHLRPVV
jgi:BirA family transcriptional regulator, biotin operon repressor / biotin---[acetyl-CoA-carboxylase] ligase